MNSYEIYILFETKEDALAIFKKQKQLYADGFENLESLLPQVFDTPIISQSKDFNIGSIEMDTNEIVLHCYGTKYPSIEISELFKGISIDSQYGIKIKSFFDGDGGNEYYCLVNSKKCSIQKYSAHYKKYKISTKKRAKNKKVNTKKSSPVKTEQQIKKKLIVKEQQSLLINKLNIVEDDGNKTAFIRLLARAKKKREVLVELFESHLSVEDKSDYENFCISFDKLVAHEDYDVSWCYLKNRNSYMWGQGPEEIIKSLSVVFEQGNYIYLGFDLEGLKDQEFDPSKYRFEQGRSQWTDLESLCFILASLDGVSKAWVKYHPLGKTGNKEYYIYYPDSGREPSQISRNTTKEYEWSSGW